ncbi:MAG: PAS domain S-box protein [Dehalococcoidales bacterium]|nr:PAS domain S-box protein [Dehalococcoidales bacterium]
MTEIPSQEPLPEETLSRYLDGGTGLDGDPAWSTLGWRMPRHDDLPIPKAGTGPPLQSDGRAIASLMESMQIYRLIAEHTRDLVVILDRDHRFAYINEAFTASTGYVAEELIGFGFFALIHPADAAAGDRLRRALAAGEEGQAEVHYRQRGGGWRYLEVIAKPIPGNLGVRAIVVGRDITEHRQVEQELRQGLIRLQSAMRGTIEAMALTLEMRDPYTAGHQRRVAALACAIAQELGLPAAEIEGLYLGAIVHDIGKIAVPAEILSKPGKLTEIELHMIRAHPRLGYDILKTVDLPWPIATLALQHHERLDGSGYPDGLQGEDIAPEARLLAVADVVEAMASHRPYRPALGVDQALAEITGHSGVLYDPAVAAACAKLHTDHGLPLP